MNATQQATRVVLELEKSGSARCEAWLSDTVRYIAQTANRNAVVHFEYDTTYPRYSKCGTVTLK